MPQEFLVLRCCQCDTFQVHQVKKASKWNCKLCGTKQSKVKVYGQGTSKDCRVHVQKLNTMRGDASQRRDQQLYEMPEETAEPPAEIHTDQLTSESRWKQYEEAADNDDDDVKDLDADDNWMSHETYTTDAVQFRQHQLNNRRNKRQNPYSKSKDNPVAGKNSDYNFHKTGSWETYSAAANLTSDERSFNSRQTSRSSCFQSASSREANKRVPQPLQPLVTENVTYPEKVDFLKEPKGHWTSSDSKISAQRSNLQLYDSTPTLQKTFISQSPKLSKSHLPPPNKSVSSKPAHASKACSSKWGQFLESEERCDDDDDSDCEDYSSFSAFLSTAANKPLN